MVMWTLVLKIMLPVFDSCRFRVYVSSSMFGSISEIMSETRSRNPYIDHRSIALWRRGLKKWLLAVAKYKWLFAK
jgi:hypothetical protein